MNSLMLFQQMPEVLPTSSNKPGAPLGGVHSPSPHDQPKLVADLRMPTQPAASSLQTPNQQQSATTVSPAQAPQVSTSLSPTPSPSPSPSP
eukprot:CAMPEP_0177662944 /NCGR_PEP_ID=MMETSP0447-20121125/19633_1 /TAXON_ID=0 /ORGANISM="Stygamoeba regulata, Strain BSH-02190019" /LENGTH=90 /DNA_ID=CAMNT_0019168689 /DNA_START=303 /DNA_END=572 /DNA_ORIENTATION=-